MLYLKKHWQKFTWLSLLLLPLSLLYCSISFFRKLFYRLGIFSTVNIGVPVIVIGNISVGGTGKTPLVIWLVKLLQKHNFKPGVVTRGYGRKSGTQSFVIQAHNTVLETGDEPAIIYQNCHCPVVVDVDRARGAAKLVTELQCDIVISDDGLQHYRLGRDMEIGVIDGTRGHGNRLCLPAGPLREPVKRLREADAVVINNQPMQYSHKNKFDMRLQTEKLVNVFDREHKEAADYFNSKTVHAVAGIGNPDQFFEKLSTLGMNVLPHPFPDHYHYNAQDITFDDHPVVMTEKDAVKLRGNRDINVNKKNNYWYLPVAAKLPRDFEQFILKTTKEKALG